MNTLSNQAELQNLGERLRTARQRMNLSEKDAASRLHLKPEIISMIETEDFANAPHATFIRGYVRSYAKFLNFSEVETNEILASIESRFPSSIQAPPTPLNIVKPQPRYNRRYTHWMTYSIVVVLVAMVGIWWNSHTRYSIADVPAKITAENAIPINTNENSLSLPALTDNKNVPTIDNQAANTIVPPLADSSAKEAKPAAPQASQTTANDEEESDSTVTPAKTAATTVSTANEESSTPEESSNPQLKVAEANNNDSANSDPYNNDY